MICCTSINNGSYYQTLYFLVIDIFVKLWYIFPGFFDEQKVKKYSNYLK